MKDSRYFSTDYLFIPALFMTTEGENIAAASSAGRREPELPDFLQLHGGDNPDMVLVSAPFDGSNFLAWKRSVVIVLRAKMKLGFIDGGNTMLTKPQAKPGLELTQW
ncbi:UNVERIFIED_CONTAM: hypothetical protein Slati_1340600 [Sesamum latifolium]|uniref:Retrotransposon Copia-like N-terminal domain-containing protein n=1 Tax=Sesamum latifolium TaxID=2727402 RepID=A0AAW2XHH1_9LAMI